MGKAKKYLLPLSRFFLFFLLMAVVVTCSFLLYLRSIDPEIVLLRKNAIATFLNILFLSFIFCVIDAFRRRLMVEKPVKRITKSLKKIKSGDFSEKIKPVASVFDNSQFNPIIEDINLLTAELSSVETLRTDFIANVSHELKTPLSVIQNYATMLQNPALTEKERIKYAKSIYSASHRLSDLITNILKLNKLENQQIFQKTEEFNLSEQICECLLNFENAFEEKSLKIETDIDEDVCINSDKELLTLIWNNLFSNAIKFTEPEGKISVSLKADDEKCIVQVSDTGCGISKEVGAHIFEKFYQGDTSHSSQGNGLGLALVKRVIDIIGGEIYVESELRKGSTFTVKLRRKSVEEI
ncbi:MAG: sensor histidine kinase [Eubacterium sp.]